MFLILTVLIIVVCILTILIVLVQNSKGGGLASNFSSSNQYMGVRKTADFLEKATWSLGAALIVLSLLAGIVIPKEGVDAESRLQGQFNETNIGNPQGIEFPDQMGTPSSDAPAE